MMKVEVVDTYEKFLGLQGVWNRLLEMSSSEHVCLTFEWMKCWWEAFSNGHRLYILLVLEADDTPIGIAPFMLTRETRWGIPLKKVEFIYNDNASRADFIIASNRECALQALCGYLRTRKNVWDVIELCNLSVESPNFRILVDALRHCSLPYLVKEGLNSPFITIDRDWQAYFASRSSKLRKTLKNQLHRLEKTAGLAIERIANGEAKEDTIDTMCSISSRSWKAKHKCDVASNPQNKRFFAALNKELGRLGWLNIWLMRIGKVDVAYEYSLCYKDKVYALRADYDQAHRHLSPGTMLHLNLLRYYFQNQAKELDLCGHDEEYKMKWAQLSRKHHTIIVYNRTLAAQLRSIAEARIAYPLKRFLKQYGPLRRLKKRLFASR